MSLTAREQIYQDLEVELVAQKLRWTLAGVNVFRAIDTERDYQQSRWGHTQSSDRPGRGERSIDEFALYIIGYAHKLGALASAGAQPSDITGTARKVIGLCVACLEQHGLPLPVTRGPAPLVQGDRTLDEFVRAIVASSDNLLEVASTFASANGKLTAVREVAGLCFACMAQHGAPLRGESTLPVIQSTN
jgi:hypothetical protein